MGTTGVYNRGKFCVATGVIQLDKSDLRVLLAGSGYVFNPNDVFTNIGAELSGAGYVRKKLANVVVTLDSLNALVKLSADPVLWNGANFGTPDVAIVYQEGVTDLTRELLCCLDLNPKITTNGGSFLLNVNSLGVLQIK